MRPRRIGPEARDALNAWFAEDPDRAVAIWEPDPDPAHPLRWPIDDKRYSPTGLVKQMARRCGYEIAVVAGPLQWVLPDGQPLPDYANEAASSCRPPAPATTN